MRRILERCKPLYQQREFRVLVVLSVLLGFASSFVSPFLSMFGTLEVKMSPVLFGVFMTVTSVCGIFFGTILSHYSDTRYSRRKMLLLGGICGTLGYAGYAYLRDFAALLAVGSLILGISTITFSQVFALAREHVARSGILPSETAFYMNVFRMFFSLSWTVGPAIASWVMIAYSFRGLFVCAAAGYFTFFAVVWFSVPEVIAGRAKPRPKGSNSIKELLMRGDVLAHFLAFVLIFAAGTIGMMNLPLLILTTIHGTQRDVGFAYSVAPAFELPLMLYFGMMATRVDSAKIIRVGMLIAVVYYTVLSFVNVPWHVYPAQILSAAVVAITSGIAITYFQNYLPHHPGSATNLYATAQRIGQTVGYLVFGAVAWRFGYRSVFMFCTGISVIAFALMYVPSRKDEPDTSIQNDQVDLPEAVV